MRWCLLDHQHTVVAYCDANTKLGAIAKLKPKDGQFVVSEASRKVGFSRTVTEALRSQDERCIVCRQFIKPGQAVRGARKHVWCHHYAP
jgi:hypothetical protein